MPGISARRWRFWPGWKTRHFTFLGYREYRLRGRKGSESLQPVEATGLGLLRRGHRRPDGGNRILSSDIRRQSRSRDLILVTKANVQSTVHRSGYLDYVGVKHFDAGGRLVGEKRFLGLWTSAAYSSNPREIPVLRRKVAQVVEHFGLASDSHDGKSLQHILESFPRDELFQAGVPELNRIVTGIFGLQERPRVRVLLRRDTFRRFYSCLVIVPREKYNTQVRQRIEKVIRDAFGAFNIESQVQIAESNLARIHIVARTNPSGEIRVDADALERRVAAAVRSWLDSFKTALLGRFDEAYALQLFEKYALAFPAAYTEDFQGGAAALDVSFLEAMEREPSRLHLDIYRPEPRRKDKFFPEDLPRPGRHSNFRPAAHAREHGAQVIAERPYELELAEGRRAWIQDLELLMQASAAVPLRCAGARDQERVHRRLDPAHGQRRLQSIDPGGRRAVAHHHGDPRLLPLPAADRNTVQPGLHCAGAGEQCVPGEAAGRSIHGPLRSGAPAGRASGRAHEARRQNPCGAREGDPLR